MNRRDVPSIATLRRRWPWLFLVVPLAGTGVDYATGHVLSSAAFRAAFRAAVEPAIRESEDRMVARVKKELAAQLEDADICRPPRRWRRGE